ncbi:hypothetical protein GUJ93_ZPchr0006g44486 [Zizania palustris]|uniref:Uncharacterized protein n=1 Tax=Zizania palustris TaxID=103762 RepID=A0A8J5SR40_ZIZPA|nr:hypothetical protein GUJ93_ZPchr0006g44486 [Zizania palustris]
MERHKLGNQKLGNHKFSTQGLLSTECINFQLWKEFQNNFPTKAINERWYYDWMLRWFYVIVGVDFGLAGPLKRSSHEHARLAEEFISLHISPLKSSWPLAFQGAKEGGLREIPSDSIGLRVMMTPKQVVRVTEKVVGAPTLGEKKLRRELVGSREWYNRVWSELGAEPS